ncbi:MAG: DUF502 domain-containing protein [Candidatus Omnitrophica bacterium]|nr:DUF502 domain-containing protein [Candidatus Omnitrophota bacterium]
MSRRLKKYFFSGLAVFLPIVLTIYVSIWILNFAEGLFGKYLRPFFLEHYDFYFWGLGIIVLLTLILFCGFLVANYFGRAAHRWGESLLLKVPVAGTMYPAFKEIAKFLFRDEQGSFQQVVMIEWPRKGVYVVGFLTNEAAPQISAIAGKKMCNVLIPSVPNPLTGFVAIVAEDELIPLKTSVEEAIKIIVSGGVVNPVIDDGAAHQV